MKNDAGNSGGIQGWYSPLHANVRAGWTWGIPCRIRFYDGADALLSVSSITRAGNVATVTTATAHGFTTGKWATIASADQSEYNGTWQITVTGGSTFTYGVNASPVTPATGTITARRCYIKHRGKLRTIDPDAGEFRTQRVHVVSYDIVRDLVETTVRSIAIQTNKTEAELITVILDALPYENQPPARSIDVGLDTFAYALYDLSGGAKAASIIKDICVDSYAVAVMLGDGTFVFKNRQTRLTGDSQATFNNNMHGFEGPVDLEQAFNLVRVTISPPTLDDTATTVLYADQQVRSIAPTTTQEFWVTYRDPLESRTLIGGLDVVDPPASGTDYLGNAQADGLGANLTASLAITLDPFGSTALVSITNNHATATVYLVDGSGNPFFQIRGRGVYNLGPQTYEGFVAAPYGIRELPVQLRYQDDALFAQDYADILAQQRSTLDNQPQSLEFIANDTGAFMTQALAREPTDLITMSETMSGFSGVDAIIQSVEFTVSAGIWLVCRWELAPAAPFSMWELGVVGFGELGETTILGT